jgi:hypothetical protein
LSRLGGTRLFLSFTAVCRCLPTRPRLLNIHFLHEENTDRDQSINRSTDITHFTVLTTSRTERLESFPISLTSLNLQTPVEYSVSEVLVRKDHHFIILYSVHFIDLSLIVVNLLLLLLLFALPSIPIPVTRPATNYSKLHNYYYIHYQQQQQRHRRKEGR